MTAILVQWLLSSLCLLLAAYIVPGFRIKGFGSALVAAVVVGILNATIWWIFFILTLPINILTLGLFTFVVNAAVLRLAAALLPGFEIRGWMPALLGALVLAVENTLVRLFFDR
jgi:putative membrane protein